MTEQALQTHSEPVQARHPLITVAVTSGKGGVGKSNVSVNLAVAAAMEGRNVSILDADLGLANVDILLGLRTERNLSHVLAGECDLDDIAISGPEGINIIPAGSGLPELTRLSDGQRVGIIEAFSNLSSVPDMLVVDTQAGVSDNVCAFSRAVQDVVVVVCDEPTALADAYSLTKVLHREHDLHRFQVVANMVKDANHGQRLFRNFAQLVDRFLDVELDLLGIVPRDEYLARAVRQQKAVVQQFPMSKSALAFRKLARSLRLKADSALLHGHVQFFAERLVMSNGTAGA